MTQDIVKAEYADPDAEGFIVSIPDATGKWWMSNGRVHPPVLLDVTSVISEKEVIYRKVDGWLARAYSSDNYSWQKAVPMIENQTQMTADNQHLGETFGPACEQQVSIEKTLQERGNRYGAFPRHAKITQSIKRAMVDSPNWSSLSDHQREALEMVAHKIGRILNGDPNYHDSWHDIIGYTKLIADGLEP